MKWTSLAASLLFLSIPAALHSADSAAQMASVVISPSDAVAGSTVSLTLALTGPAPDGGASVTVTSANPTAFPVQPAYVIPAGQQSAGFPVQTGAVTAAATATVVASYGGTSVTASLALTPPVSLLSAAFDPSTVTSGAGTALVLTLTGPAPDGGASVSVSSGNPIALPVQSSYLVPAGKSDARFTLQAGAVSAVTTVAISAGYGGGTASASVTVAPTTPAAPSLSSFAISPATIASGAAATLTFTLTGPAPTGGASIGLSAPNPVAFPAQLTYVVPAGQTSASFSVQAGTVTVATSLQIWASYGSNAPSATVTITPAPVTLAYVSVSPSTVASGATATLTFTLTGPARDGGASIAVTASNASAFPVLASYIVPAGLRSASFSVQAGAVTAPVTVAIAAVYNGASMNVSVSVNPPGAGITLSSFTISPANLVSGATATLTFTLSGPAPDGGASVSVGSGNPTAFPAQSAYPIPAGQTSATFSVQAGTVSTATTVAISAGYGGTNASASVTIVPKTSTVSLSSFTVSPANLVSGAIATLTFTLSGPAPTGGASIGLSAPNPVAFPALLTYVVPAGQSSATFTVQAGAITTATTLQIWASYGGNTAKLRSPRSLGKRPLPAEYVFFLRR